jgi:hypothetical protein
MITNTFKILSVLLLITAFQNASATITGTITQTPTSTFAPGTTSTVNFDITASSPNAEYVDALTFTLPAGVTATQVAPASGTGDCNASSDGSSGLYCGSGTSTISWWSDEGGVDGCATALPTGCGWWNLTGVATTRTFTIAITVPITYSECTLPIAYELRGDGWQCGTACSCGAYSCISGNTTLNAAPPANDNCAAATPLTVAANQASCTPTSGTNIGATDSGISWPASCNGDALSYTGGDVWYSVVVPACANLVIETSSNGPGSIDTQIAVWDACGGTLIDCSDDNPYPFSKVVLPAANLVPASTIYIGVSAYGNVDCGTFNICAYAQAPANDACAGAIALPAPDAGSCTTQTVVNNVGATPDGSMSCGLFGDPIQNNTWYSLTIPATACAGQTLNIETSSDGSTLNDTQLGVWDICGGTELACNDDKPANLYSLVTLLIGTDVNPGETIYITLDGYFALCGTTNICSYITTPACPVIDHTPDVTSVCHNGNVTFTPGATCTLGADLNGDGVEDQLADLYVYIDPATGEPGTAPAPLTIVPGTQLSQMATLHPNWLALVFDGNCATPLVGTLINTGCLPVNASLAIVTYNYALDSDCDGDESEYDGCAMLPFTITVYPDPADFEVVTTPGICGTAPTATLQLMDGTVCSTQTGTVPTCVAAPALNYSFTVNTGAPAACAAFTLSGTATSTCANCFNFGIFDPCACNNDATTLTNGTFGETVAVWNDGNGNGVLDAGEDLPAGQTWTVSAQTGATGAATGTVLTYGVIPANNPNGISGYYIQFSHVDAVGYTMSVEGPAALGTLGNATLSQAATCTYPNPSLSIAGSPFCLDAAAITLAGTEPNGANTALTPYSGTGVSGSTFTPATAGPGTHTITYNYDPAGNTTNQCLQPVTTTVTVIDCAVPCNAVNGTPTFNP